MSDEVQSQGQWFFTRANYLLVSVLVVLAGIVGVIAGRSLGQPNSRAWQPFNGNDITLPNGGLVFKTSNGKVAARLDADEGGGLFVLYNSSGQPIITMAGSTYGGGGLFGMGGGKGAGDSLRLTATEQGGRLLLFSQNRGKRVLILSANDDGGSIEVNGPTGDAAVTIDAENSGSEVSGRIRVLESTRGKLLWTAGTGTLRKP